MTLDYIEEGIRKSMFVAKTQFLYDYLIIANKSLYRVKT